MTLLSPPSRAAAAAVVATTTTAWLLWRHVHRQDANSTKQQRTPLLLSTALHDGVQRQHSQANYDNDDEYNDSLSLSTIDTRSVNGDECQSKDDTDSTATPTSTSFDDEEDNHFREASSPVGRWVPAGASSPPQSPPQQEHQQSHARPMPLAGRRKSPNNKLPSSIPLLDTKGRRHIRSLHVDTAEWYLRNDLACLTADGVLRLGSFRRQCDKFGVCCCWACGKQSLSVQSHAVVPTSSATAVALCPPCRNRARQAQLARQWESQDEKDDDDEQSWIRLFIMTMRPLYVPVAWKETLLSTTSGQR